MNNKNRSIIHVLIRLFVEIKKAKKWWLLPLWVLLASIGLILVVSGSAYLIPAIYMAF